MITQKEMQEAIGRYNKKEIAIACLGSHSALDICEGAVSEKFKTWVFCEKGRESPYSRYFKSVFENGKRTKGVVDYPITLRKFGEILAKNEQTYLLAQCLIWIPNRSFWVYCGEKEIQEKFRVPLFGSRQTLHLEDREKEPFNYYDVLMKAGIRAPEKYNSPEDIDKIGPAMIKLPHAQHPLERSFFFAATTAKFYEELEKRIEKGIAPKNDWQKLIRIERFAVGPVCNINFFYSPLNKELNLGEPLELMSTEWRFESNLDGMVRLPAHQQLALLERTPETYIVVGHAAMTVRESLLRYLFEMGEKFVKTMKELYAPGMIGPFGLQCIIEDDMKPTCYDVAFRIPGGDNITTFSGHPYLNTLWHDRMSTGRRIAFEIRRAVKHDLLEKIVT